MARTVQTSVFRRQCSEAIQSQFYRREGTSRNKHCTFVASPSQRKRVRLTPRVSTTFHCQSSE